MLATFGWNDFFEAQFAPYRDKGFAAGRVAVAHRRAYRLYTAQGEMPAEAAGKLFYEAQGSGDLPAVGDWVVVRRLPGEHKAVILAVLPRKSKFSRKAAGEHTEEQIVAANIDTVFLVSSLNQDFNLRRIERYLALAWESGAQPVIVLNKADLCPEVGARLADVAAVAPGVEVRVVSAVTGQGLAGLKEYLRDHKTVAFLGSSGVGKSSLINRLLGEQRLKTREIRATDDRGRHATSQRELILVPGGGLVIDTPGMRELQFWEAGEGLQEVFEEIEAFAAGCRFNDCQHENEPDCAVQAALARGEIDPGRLANFKKLQQEVQLLQRKQDYRARLREKWRRKTLHKALRSHLKQKYRG
ncbi:MAG: ribosome small subunit-dependent GTPase A [candidate division KSB1 bacterium]|nr:ribosome small subunit-dependent GTPase A [candidate division KSB1 bacterium]MDZ7276074.1 ribosome small subunit-dependent GTPase A [candidate division KSB1 bacterium]MDZ7287146.1 ribosome small subunit-dependent GTPase A [candidate division KSB1 bacterium]MDZ7296929.1 ribosome small subunit-dependent GTPase A [candidate division KSB1 bacterium]MDZ7309392.1 ribosome small subunit-dependent GTPase A [candidate division KSB1 bacterium]